MHIRRLRKSGLRLGASDQTALVPNYAIDMQLRIWMPCKAPGMYMCMRHDVGAARVVQSTLVNQIAFRIRIELADRRQHV